MDSHRNNDNGTFRNNFQSFEEVNVLVTGFTPFKDAPDTNASWSVANALPPVLPADPSHPSRIRISAYPQPIPVIYNDALDHVTRIHGSATTYHVVLHLGVAKNRTYYAVEQLAHKDGYKVLDLDKKLPDHSKEPPYWADQPSPLHTKAYLDDVLARWSGTVKDPKDVRISTDAGRYLCEYLYFASMAYSRHHGYDSGEWGSRTTTVFAHLPVDSSPDMIDKGRDNMIELIRALVDSRRQRDGDYDA